MQQHENILGLLFGSLAALLAPVHPWAAIGASFGCCFFLTTPAAAQGLRRVMLGLFSWGCGYAAGTFFFGEGPPWSQKAMLISAVVGALAAVLATVVHGMISSNGQLPPWAESLLKVVTTWRR